MSMNFSDLSGHIVSKVQFTTFLEERTVWYGASNEALRQRATVRVKPVHGVVGVVTVLATVRPVRGVCAASGVVPGVRPPDTLTFKVRLTDWLPTVLHPCCRAAAPRLPPRAVLPPSFVPLLLLNCAKSAHLHQRRASAGARNELATPLFSKGREILGSVGRYSMYVCTSYWVIWSAAAETWNYCCECTCEVATARRTTPTTGAVAAPRLSSPRQGRCEVSRYDKQLNIYSRKSMEHGCEI